MTMRLLGLSCGPAGGSAETLLKAALLGAEAGGAEVALLRLDELRVASDPTADDDTAWFWDTLMESGGLILSAPVLNRTIPGALKLLIDRLLGPKADVAFAMEYLALKAADADATVRFPFDERVLRPRVAGFLSVGGALTDHWKTLALPLMHAMTFSMQVGVVDQVQLGGAGIPGAIVLDDEAMARARLLGSNVASQLGRAFDAVEYLGARGVCPLCHLDVIAVRAGGFVECACCGAGGVFAVDERGRVSVEFTPEGLAQSVISVAEKRAHFFEVQETAARLWPQAGEIARRLEGFAEFDRVVGPARA